jgi:flagellar hook assembly protein FlgD
LWLPYQLADDATVTISIYNQNGQLVRNIVLGHQAAGVYISRDKAAYWNGRNNAGENVANGVYFYNLKADKFTATRRMLIVK